MRDELALHYQRAVDWVRTSRKDWDALSGVIDAAFPNLFLEEKPFG